MAVAAYASLVSLMQVLDRLQQLHSQGRIVLDSQQVQSFLGRIQSVLCFLEKSDSLKLSTEMEDLIDKISLIAVEAEFIIDNEVVDQLRVLYNDEVLVSSLDQALDRYSSFHKHLRKILCEFEKSMKTNSRNSCGGDGVLSFRTALDEVVRNIEFIDDELKSKFGREKIVDCTAYSSTVEVIEEAEQFSAPLPPTPTNAVVVGFENWMSWVMDRLTNCERSFQVIPIVGMGGIGKTTLAQSIYDHPNIQRRFDKQMWCTISQFYNVEQILRGLLGVNHYGGIHDLGQSLYQTLHGRRFLIIMDDMWEVAAWESLRLYLPDNQNGSRVIVTTRNSDVADSCGESCALSLLDHNRSWDLLRKNIFSENSCPDELQKIGKEIVKSCGGLPLSLVTIAGILSKSEMTADHWNYVARNVKGIVSSTDDEHCLKVLSLSYHFLPIYLKPCFLYLRTFREDERIEAKLLIRDWIAEGFVKPVTGKGIEDVAYEYLNDLVDRNLVLIHTRTHFGNVKLCGVHDLVRELSIRESSEVKFYSTPRNVIISSGCQLMCSRSKLKGLELESINLQEVQSSKTTRIQVCNECKMKYPFIDRTRLVHFCNRKFPTTLRSMKSYALKDLVKVPLLILPYFWNLQHFRFTRFDKRIDRYGMFLAKIWEMPHIRHLDIYGIRLPEPPASSSSIILSELLKLDALELKLSKELIDRIPNLKRLKIRRYVFGDCPDFSLHLLEGLHHLQSFTLEGNDSELNQNIKFPSSLKKLSLRSVDISWDDTMTLIGSLPNLQVLKLVNVWDRNTKEWNVKEGGFPSLKVLVL